MGLVCIQNSSLLVYSKSQKVSASYCLPFRHSRGKNQPVGGFRPPPPPACLGLNCIVSNYFWKHFCLNDRPFVFSMTDNHFDFLCHSNKISNEAKFLYSSLASSWSVFRCSSWLFLACFGFSSSDVRCCFSLIFVAFCCFSLLSRCPSLLFLAFHYSWFQPPSIVPELVRLNENGMKNALLLLFIAHFGFWCVFPFAVHCRSLPFVTFSCFKDRINSISKKVLVFCGCFHLSIALLVGTKNQNERQRQKISKWKPGLSPNSLQSF